MNIDYAFFADNATVPPDGKVYVHGGGFSAIAVPQLPARVGFAAVAGFRFSTVDVGQPISVELRLLDDADKLVVPHIDLQFQSAGPPPPEGREVSLPTVSYLSPMFGEPGDYRAEYWLGENRLATIRLRVDEQQPPAPVGERPN